MIKYIAFFILSFTLAGCTVSQPVDPPTQGTGYGTVIFTVDWDSASTRAIPSTVEFIRVTISGPDFADIIVQIDRPENQAVVQIPTGVDRLIKAEAIVTVLDENNNVIEIVQSDAEDTTYITEGTTSISLTLLLNYGTITVVID